VNVFTRILFGIVLLWATVPAWSQKPVADVAWLIVPGKGFGAITAESSEAQLVKHFGRDNVRSEDIDMGEGETEPGTVVFPDDPVRRVEVLWKDAKEKRFPWRIQIYGQKSLWHTREGVSLGTTLRELERINGKPFKLAGFAWDYSGTVYSWEGGALENALMPKDKWHLTVRLDEPAPGNPRVTDEERLSVLGEGEFRSDHPVMQKINPRIYTVSLGFDE